MSRGVRRIGLVVALALSLGLAGCAAPTTDDYPAATAQALQARVLTVTEAAASGDATAALARLDELEAALLDAHARGTVDDGRYESITAAIALVRADLEAVVAEESTAPAPGNSDKPQKPGKPDKPDKPGKD
ncbi:hypothetical protein BH09ACT5_BH09ACT5_19730 [soil metagenome]